MKKSALLTTLILLVMFTGTGLGKWVVVGDNPDGDTFYIDFDTIREGSRYVYYWELSDLSKPIAGAFSAKTYVEADCDTRQYRHLSYLWYKQSMGEGSFEIDNPEEPEWDYPPPDSVAERVLVLVCTYVM